MKIKRYTAVSMRAALAQVRAEQGPDAVILSSRRGDDGIEVIAAVDYDEALFADANRPRPAPIVVPSATTAPSEPVAPLVPGAPKLAAAQRAPAAPRPAPIAAHTAPRPAPIAAHAPPRRAAAA